MISGCERSFFLDCLIARQDNWGALQIIAEEAGSREIIPGHGSCDDLTSRHRPIMLDDYPPEIYLSGLPRGSD